MERIEVFVEDKYLGRIKSVLVDYDAANRMKRITLLGLHEGASDG